MATNLTHDDITELKKVFDDRYVRIEDCDSVQEGFNKKFANDDKRIDVMLLKQDQLRAETKRGLKFNNWLTAAVLGAIIVAVVSFYFMAT